MHFPSAAVAILFALTATASAVAQSQPPCLKSPECPYASGCSDDNPDPVTGKGCPCAHCGPGSTLDGSPCYYS
ncbi:hypothetical protein FH972_022109 [Carpinus fangiana]|uniref:Bowman-Birk serine protease inhibitors family domain-containing protein n=1 Tax=Carpinus fangiana TaxID=176857 RepID=A0A5N6KRX5_9ROSI|nr:hypothetical protein FH972_022109 [Carpinus fangiana]